MSKHSKWQNIKHKKAIQDAKKSKIYTKIAKLIEIAARNGVDPSKNPSLEVPLQKARYYSVPRSVIDKALAKAAGKNDGEQLVEVVYEGYGPGGSAFIVKAITSNKNRTAASLKLHFSRHGGNLGEPGSVGRQFDEKGIISVAGLNHKETIKGNEQVVVKPFDTDKLENDLMELPVSDYSIEDGICNIETSNTNFLVVERALNKLGYSIEMAELQYIPNNEQKLSLEDMEMCQKLIDAFDEDDDVDEVFHNAVEE